jgi:hypothetical protein
MQRRSSILRERDLPDELALHARGRRVQSGRHLLRRAVLHGNADMLHGNARSISHQLLRAGEWNLSNRLRELQLRGAGDANRDADW